MNGVVIYKSTYGTTKEYATWISEDLGFPVYTLKEFDADKISAYDILIFASSVYVGKMKIAPWMKGQWEALSKKNVYLLSVGATPQEDAPELNKIMQVSFTDEMIRYMHHFHAVGRVRIRELHWLYKILMWGKFGLSKDEKERAVWKQGYDKVDRSYILPLVSHVRQHMIVP